MKYIILISLIFLNFSYSQKKIIDYETKKEIPYAAILLQKANKIIYGTYTEFNGEFAIEKSQLFDSLIVECMGYHKRAVDRNQIESKDTLFLKQKHYLLQEVIVTNKKTKELGYLNMPNTSFYGIGKGLEKIVFIENSANEYHTISAFLFQVEKIKTRIGFRIHFYKKAIDSFMPDEEITNQNKIYFLEKGSKGQIEIDLIDLGLEIPLNGIFIGLEALGEFDEKTNLFLPFEKNKIPSFLNFKVHKSKNATSFIRNIIYKNGWTNDCDWQKTDYKMNFKKDLEYCLVPSFGLKIKK
jgi:hypothetical protein